VYAQTAVLNHDGRRVSGNAPEYFKNPNEDTYSTFTFQQSFILNSVGFASSYADLFSGLALSYKIDNGSWIPVTGLGQNDLDETGVGYFNFTNPQTYAAGTQISVKAKWGGESIFGMLDASKAATNVAGITHSTPYAGYASGNLKVTPLDPGSNVAPEPGSFALALTGGAALLGICVRRRRNAG
jgi:hypothetical protein